MEKAFILGIDEYFDKLFEEDKEFKRIVYINESTIDQEKDGYRKKFNAIISDLKINAKEKRSKLTMELKMLESAKFDAILEHDQKLFDVLNKFYHTKKHIFNEIQESQYNKELNSDANITKIKIETENITDIFMDREMQFVDQFEV